MADYQDILQSLNVSNIEIIRSGKEGRIFICKGLWQDKVVLVKILDKTSGKKLKQLNKEILVSKIITSKFDSEELLFTPVLLDGEDSRSRWVIREYMEGESLVKFDEGKRTLLFGYDLVESRYMKNMPEIIESLREYLSKINSIKFNELPQANIYDEFKTPRFNPKLDQEVIRNIELICDVRLEPLKFFYDENSKLFSDNGVFSAIHGDFVPANIIVTDSSKIFVTDYEWFCFDHWIMDVAYFWLFLHKYPELQKRVIGLFITGESDRLAFRLSVIRSIVGWYSLLGYFKDGKIEISKNYEKHIWIKYLIAAGESFKTLVK